MKYSLKLFFLLCGTCVLSGCDDSADSDTRAYVHRVQTAKPRPVEPLPSNAPYLGVRYSGGDLRSPFEIPLAFIQVVQEAPAEKPLYTGPHPDFGRVRELLEGMPLDAFSMVGTIKQSKEMWGLVRDKLGVVYRIGVGQYIGQNYGKVIKVTHNKIELKEMLADGQGGWRERPMALSLSN